MLGVLAVTDIKAAAATGTSTTKKAPKTTTTPNTKTPKPVETTTTTPKPATTTTPHTTSTLPKSSSQTSVVSSVITSSSLPASNSIMSTTSVTPSTSIAFVTSITSSSSPLPTTNAAVSTNSSSNTNLIGPVVGAVGGAAVVLGAGILLWRRRRSKRERNNADQTFSDYLAGSEGMHSPGKGNLDKTYNVRNSTNIRSPASIAAGIHQQPSPRMMPAVGGLTAGAIAASQQKWSTSSHHSPDNTLVGSPQMSQMYRPGGDYSHYDYNGYYNQPNYPHGQAYYEHSADPYQYPGDYQPYFDPQTEQYLYPASGSEAPVPSTSASPAQAPHTYDQQSHQEQLDYRNSPLPPPAQTSSHSVRSSMDEPRFPTDNPALQAANMSDQSSSAVHKPDSSTAGQN